LAERGLKRGQKAVTTNLQGNQKLSLEFTDLKAVKNYVML